MAEVDNLFNAKIEEYKFLRDEMNSLVEAQASLANICLTSVTAIFAFAFSQLNALTLFAAYPVIFFLLSFYKRKREGVVHIAGYMIVYLEPIIGINWETINQAEYKKQGLDNKKIEKTFGIIPTIIFGGR